MSYQSAVACWDVREQREQLRLWTAILHCHGSFLSVSGDLQSSAPTLHVGALAPRGDGCRGPGGEAVALLVSPLGVRACQGQAGWPVWHPRFAQLSLASSKA